MYRAYIDTATAASSLYDQSPQGEELQTNVSSLGCRMVCIAADYVMKLNRTTPIYKATRLRPLRPSVVRASENEAGKRFSSGWSRPVTPVKETLEKMVEPDAGYEMVLFPFLRKVGERDDGDLVSGELEEARSVEMRRLATEQLVNIDIPERTRRKIFGGALLCLTLAVDAWLIAERAGFWPRIATFPLLFFGAAYFSSGQMGLCNIAQADMWQVEGKGLRKIEDPIVARRIRERVNKFTATTSAICFVLLIGFALMPL